MTATSSGSAGVDAIGGVLTDDAATLAAEARSLGDGQTLHGRSPGQLALIRLRRDRTARISAITVAVFLILALAAPLIAKLYGSGPNDRYQELTDASGMPLGYLGGVTGSHWLGLEPQSGYDIFIRLVYGVRTSLLIAFFASLISTSIGVVVGITAGYLGGWRDKTIGWVIDFLLALPFLLFAIAVIPLVEDTFFTQRQAISTPFEIGIIVAIFTVFGWLGTARLVRGQVVSLREREFVDAARASGASTSHILFKQLLPNLWAPILVSFSLAVPSYITSEAALAFLGIGLGPDVPDFGRMIFRSTDYLQVDPAYALFPGFGLLLLVLAFNLLGDSVRDALDPKSTR